MVPVCWVMVIAATAPSAAQLPDRPVSPGITAASEPGAGSGPSVYREVLQFGGPSSVGGQLAEDASIAPQFRLPAVQLRSQRWFDVKGRVDERRGLQFNIDESILFQAATNSPGETEAASGLVRVYGQWELFGRDTPHRGQLVTQLRRLVNGLVDKILLDSQLAAKLLIVSVHRFNRMEDIG